jgi:hypothetical protein
MSETPKSGKKDSNPSRETLEELNEVVPQQEPAAQYRNPNRDRAAAIGIGPAPPRRGAARAASAGVSFCPT